MEHWWEPTIRGLVGGRRVILAGGLGTAWTPIVATLRRLGADDVLVVATEGTGAGPTPDARLVSVEPPHDTSMLASIRFSIAALHAPSEEVRDAVEMFDPDRRAVLVGHFLNEAPHLVGRPFVHHRRPEWVALEDKVVVDELWDRAGVRRAPSAVVPLEEAWAASRRIGGSHGTVWAADATAGWHGGGHHTVWVNDAGEANAAVNALGGVAERVRVMPFLEGVPCSIHGVVVHDGVVVLRPVEMVTLRRGHELVYAGCSTFWDPGERWRDEMRTIARRVGEHLRERVGFRGAFTIDGVATIDGFVPTELNPRPGAGLGVIQSALAADTPLMLLVDLAAAGLDLGAPAARIEQEWLAAADRTRGGGTWRFGVATGAERSVFELWFDGTEWHPARPDRTDRHHEPRDRGVSSDPGEVDEVDEVDELDPTTTARSAMASAAVAPRGARAMLDPTTWPSGPSVASAAAAFYRYLDASYGTDFGALTPAADPTRPGRQP